jgi:ATP-dependent RNA helicase DDX19/DBP5
MENADRDRIIDQFRLNTFTTLISSNVLARGIDVPQVDLVINYDVPMIKKCGFYDPDFANYMHRVGRTGRFGTDGLALSITSNELEEEAMDLIAKHYAVDVT